jgi:hypothetical protein
LCPFLTGVASSSNAEALRFLLRDMVPGAGEALCTIVVSPKQESNQLM